jgi:hypothetical protein
MVAVENAPWVIPERTGEGRWSAAERAVPAPDRGYALVPEGWRTPPSQRLPKEFDPRYFASRHTARGALSSRSALNAGCRALPLRAHWANSTSQTSFGSAHLARDTAKSV